MTAEREINPPYSASISFTYLQAGPDSKIYLCGEGLRKVRIIVSPGFSNTRLSNVTKPTFSNSLYTQSRKRPVSPEIPLVCVVEGVNDRSINNKEDQSCQPMYMLRHKS